MPACFAVRNQTSSPLARAGALGGLLFAGRCPATPCQGLGRPWTRTVYDYLGRFWARAVTDYLGRPWTRTITDDQDRSDGRA